MSEARAYQVADWNGRNGDQWVANQDRLDHMLAAFGDAAIAAAVPRSGERVLDIGCGAGATSLAIADRVGPEGHVRGVDISEPLIARARDAAPPGAPMSFELADAARAALPAQCFDLLFSRFGVMFFDDPVAAFAHMRAALKRNGRLAFVCWRAASENDWVRLPMEAVRDLVPPSPPPDPEAPGPFSFGDRNRIAHILTAAGFTEVDIAPFDHNLPFGRGATRAEAIENAVDLAFQVGPLSRVLIDQPDSVCRRAADALRSAFAARPGEGSVMIDGAAWIVTARNRGVRSDGS
jgi:SAM-dependent methyltransferase